jgi:Zn-dependent protease/CBS domain-containing protein
VLNDSFRLGRLRGISIGVHWSVLFIAGLLAWGLATRILPTAAAGQPVGAYWAAGILVAGMFFVSLLAHELAHAFFAVRAGVRVEGITLWLLGGVARLDGDASTPGHDLRIAASGPIVSGLLGIGFGGIATWLSATGVAPLVAEAALWLARVNLLLAVFNLLPGAPLDGGRIVRSVAWRLGRDRLRAALVATRIGRALGFGLVAFGMLELVLGADPGGIWTIVIGLFMTGAAAAERNAELARDALGGLRVRDVMTREPVRVPAGITVDLFADSILAGGGQNAALAVEANGEVLGVAGLAEASALRGGRRREARVRDITVPLASVPVAQPDEAVLEAFERTATSGRAARGPRGAYLLVVDDGAIVGIVSGGDVARTIAAHGAAASRGRSARPAPEGQAQR